MVIQGVDNWQEFAELSLLRQINHPPKKLFIRGELDWSILQNCVAVVGSRRMTEYGRLVMEKLIPKLVLEKKTIVSGFMYGVDQYAHKLCLESGGKTVAVLGWGISQPLEGYEQKLANQILASGGMIISEWENQKPTLWTFPVRNRIVAGLAKEVYVVEATLKSGSLITAQLASKFNRTVWAIPGSIHNRTSSGTNALIAEGRAKLWTYTDNGFGSNNSDTNDPILKILGDEALTANEVALKLNKPIANVGAQLSLFVLTGQLIEREGKYYLNHVS